MSCIPPDLAFSSLRPSPRRRPLASHAALALAGLVTLAGSAVVGCGGDDSTVDSTTTSAAGTGGGGASSTGSTGSTSSTSGAGGAPETSSSTGTQSGIQTVEVVPDPDLICPGSCLEVAAGTPRKFVATAKNAKGETVDATFTWSTSDAAVATVDDDGVVTGLVPGQVEVRAAAGGVTGKATATILPKPLAAIDIAPNPVALAQVGSTEAVTATGKDEDGKVVPGLEFAFVTTNPLVATVSKTGATGATVTATGEGIAFVGATTTENQGYGTAQVTVKSVLPTKTPFALTTVATGVLHGCGLASGGVPWCWGWNYFGQLGNGSVGAATDSFPTPDAVEGGHSFASLSLGLHHSCALEADGDAWCWGLNDTGQLGIADTNVGGTTVPYEVEGGLQFATIVAGGGHTCALDAAGKAWCFGLGNEGQLGTGTSADARNPVAVSSTAVFEALALGLSTTCALDDAGKAHCWGSNTDGQLGNGASGDAAFELAPVAVSGDRAFTSLAMTSSHVCGVVADGDVYCWGRGDFGQLGQGKQEDASVPTKVASDKEWKAVATGAHHTCALDAAGKAWCWGDNFSGQIGNGTVERQLAPVAVLGDLVFTSIHASGNYTCGMTSAGPYCWGSAFYGETGGGFSGDAALSPAPWPIATPAG